MTVIDDTIGVAELVARVEQLRPVIDAQRERAELDCQLDPSVYAALADGGFFGLLVPRAYGGLEMDLADAATVIAALASVDGAAAWNLNQSVAVSASVSWYRDAYDLAYADPQTVYAGVFWPPLPAVEVDGGLRVSGRLPFASGSRYASWFEAFAMLTADGEPVPDPQTGAPQIRAILLPMDEVQIEETWDPVGMRATGSNDAVLDDVFVPTARIVDPFVAVGKPRPDETAHAVYGMGPWVNSVLHAAVPLGLARSIIAQVTEIATTKVPNFFETPLRTKRTVQSDLARAKATTEAAAAFLDRAARQAQAGIANHGSLARDEMIDLQLAASNATTASLAAVERVSDVAGTSTIRRGSDLERKIRDLRTIVRHVSIQEARYEDAGAAMLGEQPEWICFLL